MIYLHKLLPALFLPVGLTTLLVVSGLLLRRRWLCWLSLAVLWLASTPLLGNAAVRTANGWQVRQPLAAAPHTQAIVVLSGGRIQPPGDPTVSEWTDAIDRFYGGVDLYKAGKAPFLIFTGAWLTWRPNVKPEGDGLTEYAVNLGVPRDHILTTGKVMNTDAEARAVAELLADQEDSHGAPTVAARSGPGRAGRGAGGVVDGRGAGRQFCGGGAAAGLRIVALARGGAGRGKGKPAG
ncbi:MAG: YdcF family protein [Caldilineaceae bacterium]|nr:YdcF family protein [Caldilineaceae bacterium]